MSKQTQTAKKAAINNLEHIKDVVAALEWAESSQAPEDAPQGVKDLVTNWEEDLQQYEDCPEEVRDVLIHQDPLSVEVRDNWHRPGAEDDGPAEYRIVLCTGGPHIEINGSLDQYGQPYDARIKYFWGTESGDLRLTGDSERDALEYARQFYFGQ